MQNYETIEIEIDDDVFIAIAKMAHEKNITFNEMAIEILKEQLKKEQSN